MGCTCFARYLLIIVNIIVAILAFMVVILGSILAWNPNVIKSVSAKHLIVVEEHKDDDFGPGKQHNVEVILEMILRIATPIGTLIFIGSLTTFLFCIFGIIGICYKNILIIRMYLALHCVLFFLETFLVTLTFAGSYTFTGKLQLSMQSNMRLFGTPNSTEINDILLSLVMLNFECCGHQNGTELHRTAEEINDLLSREFVKGYIFRSQRTMTYPVACCKMDPMFRPVMGCPDRFDERNSNIFVGCWPQIVNTISDHAHKVAFICTTILGIQLLLIMFTIVLASNRNKVHPLMESSFEMES